jgi:hypothetical protein
MSTAYWLIVREALQRPYGGSVGNRVRFNQHPCPVVTRLSDEPAWSFAFHLRLDHECEIVDDKTRGGSVILRRFELKENRLTPKRRRVKRLQAVTERGLQVRKCLQRGEVAVGVPHLDAQFVERVRGRLLLRGDVEEERQRVPLCAG